MNVLAVDTAGPVIGVALLSGDPVMGPVRVRTERVTRGADTRLMPWAEELADEAGLALADLDGVAVAVGPGAFTGLRVGLAAALGLATALGCPVAPQRTLRTRAERWLSDDGVLLSALDARKERLYAEVWHGRTLERPAEDITPEAVLAGLAPGFRAVGEGALAYRSQVEAHGGVLVDPCDDPAVDSLARLGAQALAAGEGLAPAEVRPTYLRPPDAKPRTSR